MPLDVDYIAGRQAIERIMAKIGNAPHMEREEIADKIIEFEKTL